MKGPFQTLNARAICHATEDIDKVKHALTSALGPTEIQVSRIEGHHGNSIFVLEAALDKQKEIQGFFERLSTTDLRTLLGTLASRIDDGCNLFIRLDKQSSYGGRMTLASNDDVISIRLRVLAFPARCEVASTSVKEFLESILKARE